MCAEFTKFRITGVVFLLVSILTPCFAEYFSYNASYDLCFTPGENCTEKIVNELSQAKEQILVQAYSFTSRIIANELIKAKRKGIDVKIILDKSQLKTPYSMLRFFRNSRIPVTIDHLPAIAHNKIMIIDKYTVIGGSYNHTQNAEKRNAENVIIVRDSIFAQKYINNWYNRKRKSVSVDRVGSVAF